mgnify:CR=1 FL=1
MGLIFGCAQAYSGIILKRTEKKGAESHGRGDVSMPVYPAEQKIRNYLFRVTYYKSRINLEVFHVLTDGMGGINFLRELTYQYLRLVHPETGGKKKETN